jgi:hypothetical protein
MMARTSGDGTMSQDLESIAATLVADGKGILAAVPIPLGSGVVFFLARGSAATSPSHLGRHCDG